VEEMRRSHMQSDENLQQAVANARHAICAPRVEGALAQTLASSLASLRHAAKAGPIAAAAEVEAVELVAGCGAARSPTAGCGSDGLPDPAASQALLIRTVSLKRLNMHHASCWELPRCHDRMYVMQLEASAVGGGRVGGWSRRVPKLYRVESSAQTKSGQHTHTYQDLAAAWEARGKSLPYDTGGANVDTLVSMQLVRARRSILAEEFLALPVGRDMMLWNIVADREGLHAIDQDGKIYPDAAVPWEQRAMPYCLTVGDCYEKALGALCGTRTPPRKGELTECYATLAAERCPNRSLPFPCQNGCQSTFKDCRRTQ